MSMPKIVIHNHLAGRTRDAKKLVKSVKRRDGEAKIFEMDDGEFEVVFPDGDTGVYPSLRSAIQQAQA